MTTNVTVEAFSHDVEVRRVDSASNDDAMPVEIVTKGNKVVFYAHQGQDIHVREVRDHASSG